MSQLMTQRESEMLSIIESDGLMSAVNEMLTPKEVGAFKQAMLTMAANEGLKKATVQSIISCGLEAARLKLPLAAGQGYIVVYKTNAQLDIGYKGWQMIAKRAGLDVLADVVTEVDDFRLSGFGFELDIDFTPSPDRQVHNDAWLEQNFKGVIVSVRESSTGLITKQYVDAGMIRKIAGMSKGANSDYSPYKSWRLQMYQAKAIKYVLSKASADINSHLQQAVDISSKYEMERQANLENAKKQVMDDLRFMELLPQWQALVNKGTSPAKILSAVTKKAVLTPDQIDQIMNLAPVVPDDVIEGELNSEPKKQSEGVPEHA